MRIEFNYAQAMTIKELLLKEIDRIWHDDYMPRVLDKSIENVVRIRKEWEEGKLDNGFTDKERCIFHSLDKINKAIDEANKLGG